MTRWKVVPAAKDIIVRETDWTAQFDCHNVDTGQLVKIEITQYLGGPVSDLIGALRATAHALVRAATQDDTPLKGEDKLN
jgi:hypothetical protein